MNNTKVEENVGIWAMQMPRQSEISPTSKKRKKWDPNQMKKAIEAVRTKVMGFKKAEKIFCVPKTTLKRLVDDSEESLELLVHKPLGRKPVLPYDLEKQLVQYILFMDSRYYGLTKRDICKLAYQLASKNNIQNNFRKEVAGRAWLYSFLKRHKDSLLLLRRPLGASDTSAQSFNREVKDFFDILEAEMSKTNYPPDRIFNVDETGLTFVQMKEPQVIVKKGQRQIGSLTAAERESLCTIVCCMSASGIFVPPMMIFPRKNFTDSLMKGAPPGSIGKVHPSGWIQSNLFTDWFRHFIEKTNPSEASPVILILNGHYSHTRSLEVIELARENNVTIISLPPRTSHRLQPLGKTFLGALKSQYSEEIREFHLHSQIMPKPNDIAELLGRAYLKSTTGEIAGNCFSETGIYPFNPPLFTEDDFTAEASNIRQSSRITDNNQNMTVFVNQGPPGESTVDTSDVADQSNTEVYTAAWTAPQELTTDLVLPEDILPISGRKASKAKVITSSPNKGRGGRLRRRRGRRDCLGRRQDRGKDFTSSSSDSECDAVVGTATEYDDSVYHNSIPENSNTNCIFCDASLSDTLGETWIQCQSCNLWAHTACAGPEGKFYVCDFCR